MRFTYALLSLVFLSFLGEASGQSVVAPQHTVFEYAGEPRIFLDGNWKFYWKELYSENPSIVEQQSDLLVSCPTTWNDFVIDGQELGSFGYATFVAYVDVARHYEDVALVLSGFYSAYRLYINGSLVASNGVLGKSKETSTLEWRPQLVRASLHKGRNVLVVEVSNYQHSKGGFFDSIKLGQYQHLTDLRKTELIISTFTAGAFVMIGSFFLGMYLFWRRSKQILFYVIFALSYSLRIFTTGLHLFNFVFDEVSWQVSLKLEYLSLGVCWVSTLLLFSNLMPRKMLNLSVSLYLVFLSAILLLPLFLYSQILPAGIVFSSFLFVFLVFRLFKVKHDNPKVFRTTLVFFVLASLSWLLDYLAYALVINEMLYLPNAMRFFAVLSLAFMVSQQYTVEYETVENLQIETQKQKKVIEQQVEELKTQKLSLEERNNKVETLFREVHHRVKNNLQLISSLLDVQRDWHEVDESSKVLEDSRTRIATMSLIHQSLYQTDDISTINLKSYTTNLVEQIKSINKSDTPVSVTIDVDEVYFDVDTAVPLGLILNELVTNAFKYAFDEVRQGKLSVVFEGGAEGDHVLYVSDNGGALLSPFDELIQTGFGLRLAVRLSRQLQGSLSHRYEKGNIFVVRFKDTVTRKKVE